MRPLCALSGSPLFVARVSLSLSLRPNIGLLVAHPPSLSVPSSGSEGNWLMSVMSCCAVPVKTAAFLFDPCIISLLIFIDYLFMGLFRAFLFDEHSGVFLTTSTLSSRLIRVIPSAAEPGKAGMDGVSQPETESPDITILVITPRAEWSG